MGLCYGAGRLANVASPFVVSALFTSFGYVSVFIYIASTWLIVALLVAVFGPSTTGRSLDELNPAIAGTERELAGVPTTPL